MLLFHRITRSSWYIPRRMAALCVKLMMPCLSSSLSSTYLSSTNGLRISWSWSKSNNFSWSRDPWFSLYYSFLMDLLHVFSYKLLFHICPWHLWIFLICFFQGCLSSYWAVKKFTGWWRSFLLLTPICCCNPLFF